MSTKITIKYKKGIRVAVIAEAKKGRMVVGVITKINTETDKKGTKTKYTLGSSRVEKSEFFESSLTSVKEAIDIATDFLLRRIVNIREGVIDKNY